MVAREPGKQGREGRLKERANNGDDSKIRLNELVKELHRDNKDQKRRNEQLEEEYSHQWTWMSRERDEAELFRYQAVEE